MNPTSEVRNARSEGSPNWENRNGVWAGRGDVGPSCEVVVRSSGFGVLADLGIRFSGFLASGRFPAFALCLLTFYQILIAWIAFVPVGGGAWANFVEDFRVRCFQYDPANGWMRLGYIWTMLAEPVPLQLVLCFLWHAPLRELWRAERRALLPLVGSALLVVGAIAAGLSAVRRAPAKAAELPFPADRLRSALPMPAFRLTNQDGETVSLAGFKGQVVLVTAVYSSCTKTCPMMLTKIRSVLDQLTPQEREGLAVLAFSLSPEADTRELRARTAQLYGMESPRFHFVNGVPAEINALLDQLNVARVRDETTGEITHSNLFFLLDREGRIAYRLSLSQNEQSWLISALRVLLAEKAAEGG